MLRITHFLSIPDDELAYFYVQASGPGGQNVNKVATGVQLRFDVINSPSLNVDEKSRLITLGGKKISKNGILVIEAKRYRTQEQNRSDAENRLLTLIKKALIQPKTRVSTHPTKVSKARRVDSKKHRGKIKRMRQSSDD